MNAWDACINEPWHDKTHALIQKGGGGKKSGPPLENHKTIRFLSTTGSDPPEKANIQL